VAGTFWWLRTASAKRGRLVPKKEPPTGRWCPGGSGEGLAQARLAKPVWGLAAGRRATVARWRWRHRA